MIVTCPECEERISSEASLCPRCGLPKAGALSKELNQYFVENFEVAEKYFQDSKDIGIINWRKRKCYSCNSHSFRLLKVSLVHKKTGVGYGISCSSKCGPCGGGSREEIVVIATTNQYLQLEWKMMDYFV